MRQVINILTGFILGLAPLGAAVILGLVVYASLPNSTGIVIIGTIGLFALWIGIQIFRRVQIVGPIEFLSAVHASPDLDNLEPTEDSKTKRRNSVELIELIEIKENLFKGGTFRIFGDWFGKPFDNYHEIESAQFDSQLKILTLNFKEGEKLEIYNPEHIFEASTFIKIIKADRIRLTWFYYGKSQNTENQYFLDYKKEDTNIRTDSNVDWYEPKFDVSLGAPALMIYG